MPTETLSQRSNFKLTIGQGWYIIVDKPLQGMCTLDNELNMIRYAAQAWFKIMLSTAGLEDSKLKVVN